MTRRPGKAGPGGWGGGAAHERFQTLGQVHVFMCAHKKVLRACPVFHGVLGEH